MSTTEPLLSCTSSDQTAAAPSGTSIQNPLSSSNHPPQPLQQQQQQQPSWAENLAADVACSTAAATRDMVGWTWMADEMWKLAEEMSIFAAVHGRDGGRAENFVSFFGAGTDSMSGSGSGGYGGGADPPQLLLRTFSGKVLRYRRLSFFIAAVTLINAICSLMLLEAILGGGVLCVFWRCSKPSVASHGRAYDIPSLNQSSASPHPFILKSPQKPLLNSASIEVDTSVEAKTAEQLSRAEPSDFEDLTSQQASSFSGDDSKSAFDEGFVRRMSSSWQVSTYSSVEGVYVLQKDKSPSCLLLLQNACYLFMMGSSDLHGRFTGVWFAQEALGSNLSDSPEPYKINMESRDFSEIDFRSKVCTRFRPDPSAPGADSVLGPDLEEDLPALKRRENRTSGRFVSLESLDVFLRESSSTSKRMFRDRVDASHYAGLSGNFDSHVGQLGERVYPVAEAAAQLLEAQNGENSETEGVGFAGGNHPGAPNQDFSLFFPSNRDVFSSWTRGAAKMAFGPEAKAIPGQVQGQPICFRNALFLLTSKHFNSTVDKLRNQAWGLVNMATLASKFGADGASKLSRAQTQQREGLVTGPGSIVTTQTFSVANAVSNLRLAQDQGRSRQFWKDFSRTGETFQITIADVAEDGVGVKSGPIANMEDVVNLIQAMFPRLTVQRVQFPERTGLEQAAIMMHTVLFISIHSGSLSNTIFMPRGSVALELFPYHFRSDAVRDVALRSGVNYLKWENTYVANSAYVDDCFGAKGFEALPLEECRRVRQCLFCVRDKSFTTVHLGELRDVLRQTQKPIRDFLFEKKKRTWSSSD